MTTYISSINIPAYDAAGEGLVVMLRLTTIIDELPSIFATGNIAEALKPNFQRIIGIMATIKKSWECFRNYKYILECDNDHFIVKDSKSSSMAISIALLNTYREILGKPQIQGLSGTGILRIDGSFENSRHETKKYLATVRSDDYLKHFITSNECKHLYDLEQFMC
jgi:hypothetical protein